MERPLTKHDMLFIFSGTFPFYTPVTADSFAKTLTKVSIKLKFAGIKLTMSNMEYLLPCLKQ